MAAVSWASHSDRQQCVRQQRWQMAVCMCTGTMHPTVSHTCKTLSKV
jgi:hypothetical protein